MSAERRQAMIAPEHPDLSITRQCRLLSIARSRDYRTPAGESEMNLALMRLIDAQFLETPWYGSRQMARRLRRQGWGAGANECGGRCARWGWCRSIRGRGPACRIPSPHRVYPDLLRDLAIEQPNQV